MKLHALVFLLCAAACTSVPFAPIGLGEVVICRSDVGAPAVAARIAWRETDPVFGEIVHASVRPIEGEDRRALTHGAFTPEAVAGCEEGSRGAFGDADPAFAADYRRWKQAFVSGFGGVFDISPADAWGATVGASSPAEPAS